MNLELLPEIGRLRSVGLSSPNVHRRLGALASRTPITKVMTQDVTYVVPGMDLMTDAREKLLEAGVWVAPVVDDEMRPVGMICLNDVLRDPRDFEEGGIPLSAFTSEGYHYQLGAGFHIAPSSELLVGDVMTQLTETLSIDTSIAQAAAHLGYGKVGSMVVVDDAGKLRGLVTRGNINRWIVSKTKYSQSLKSTRP